MNHSIAFPGLGIGEFTVNDTAFTLFGSLSIAWYGIIIVTGIILAVLYIYLRSKRDRLLLDDLIDIAFATVIPAIIGARLYYVFFKWLEDPDMYKSFIDVINIRQGGLAVYGGVIFGLAGAFTIMRIKKINVLKFFDCGVGGLMLAQALGRWGNFFNAEAYGGETSLPWGMSIDGRAPVHPTFLYESLWNVIGFVLLDRVILKHKKYDGEGFLFYITWYGLGRAFIEGLRTDSLYIGNSGIRVSQLVAAVCCVVGAVLMIVFRVIPKKLPYGDCMYLKDSKKYAKVMESSEDSKEANGSIVFAASGVSDGQTEAQASEVSDEEPGQEGSGTEVSNDGEEHDGEHDN